MQTSTAFAPSPQSDSQSDSFAAFLARLAELPDWGADLNSAMDSVGKISQSGLPVQSSSADAGEDDLSSLSYEHALRAPSRLQSSPTQRAQNKPSSKRAAKAELATRPSPSTKLATATAVTSAIAVKPAPAALEIAEPRPTRTTIRFTAGENKLLRKRALENGLAVSAYVRSCVFEVEALRDQVRQLMTELQTVAASGPAHRPVYSVTEPQAPALTAQPVQPALPAPQAQRPLQPLAARDTRPAPAFRLDPRIQAAFDAQKRIAARSYPATPEKKRSGFFSFLFGGRKTA